MDPNTLAPQNVNITEAVSLFVKRYATFGGRSSRSEFWWVMLATFIAGLVLGVIAQAAGTNMITYLFYLATFLPSLSLACRRLHDSGKSGWLLLLSLIPFVGVIILLFFYIQASDPQDNQYGPASA